MLVLMLNLGARNRKALTQKLSSQSVSLMVGPPGDSDASRDSAVALSVGRGDDLIISG